MTTFSRSPLFVNPGLLMERVLEITTKYIPLPFGLFVCLEAKKEETSLEHNSDPEKTNYPQAEADL